MAVTNQCANCGGTVSESVACGECPTCLLQMAISTLREAAAKPGPMPVPSPAELDLPGFELLELIGRGGMGAVYKARQIRLDRVVAIKILPVPRAKNLRMSERFVREGKLLAQLHHQRFVTVFDAGIADETAYLVMEYIDGLDLAHLVRQDGPVDPRQACRWIREVAHALAFAHREGFTHRDVKPGNLMLNPAGEVKILDLGLAGAKKDVAESFDHSLTDAGTVQGTLDYMAPEQAADMRSADARSDIYSLGCALYYLLTGERVFREETPVNTILAHRERPAPPLLDARPDAPRELDAVFQKMVAKSPTDRQQTMEEVVQDLAAIEAGGQQRPTPITSGMSGRRGWWVSAAVAVLMVAVLLALGVFLYRVQTDKGTIVVRVDESVANQIDVKLKDDGLEIVNLDGAESKRLPPGGEASLRSGTWQLQPNSGLQFTARNQAGTELDTDRFSIRRHDRIVVEVTMAPAAVSGVKSETGSPLAGEPATTIAPNQAAPPIAAMFVDSGQSLPAQQFDAAMGDLNEDGFPDLVCGGVNRSNYLSIFLNDGNGRLLSPRTFSGHTNWGVTLTDLDGDLDLDLFVTLWGALPAVFLNDGQGIFESQPNAFSGADDPHTLFGTGAAAGDVDGDGDVDVVESFHGGEIAVCLWRNDGQARFQRDFELSIDGSEATYGIDLADFDGDRDLDLAFTTWRGELFIAINGGHGQFELAEPIRTTPHLMGVAVGDLDNDGHHDMCVTFDGADKIVRLFLNDGQAHFTESDQLDGKGRAGQPLLVDLDNDGDLDIVVPRRWDVGKVLPVPHDVWWNQGRAEFERAVVPPASCESNAVAAGDLDADGDVDLIFSTQFSSAGHVWLNQRANGSSHGS